jgi:hypothetical protein
MNKLIAASLLFLASAAATTACDTCGCELCEPGTLGNVTQTGVIGGKSPYNIQGSVEQQSYFFTGVAEQFTAFHTLRDGGDQVQNTAGEFEDSSITQFLLGYQINSRLSIQVNLPYIYRTFQRQLDTTTQKGSVAGLGDISLHVNYVALRLEQADWGFSWSATAGVKFPTGSYAYLDEVADPSFPDTVIGGHDLTLGSGSYDGDIGTSLNAHWNRAFFIGDVDYTMRGTGHAGYRYANELSWSGGPGCRLLQGATYSLSLQALASGGYKRLDTLNGVEDPDTGITELMIGPKVILATSGGIAASLGVELPVIQHDTGLQAVADYRLKASLIFKL